MTTKTQTPALAVLELDAGTFETCDACGAIAAYEIILPNSGTLTFCGHHARANGFTDSAPRPVDTSAPLLGADGTDDDTPPPTDPFQPPYMR